MRDHPAGDADRIKTLTEWWKTIEHKHPLNEICLSTPLVAWDIYVGMDIGLGTDRTVITRLPIERSHRSS